MENNDGPTAAEGIANLDEARESKRSSKGGDKEEKDTAEMLWQRELMRRGDMAMEVDAAGNAILYRWKGTHWQSVQSSTELEALVVRFMNRSQQKLRAGAVAGCCKLTEAIIYDQGIRLEKPRHRALIAVRNFVLEIMPNGQIHVHDHDQATKRILVRSFVDVHIDTDKIKDGVYTPCTNEEIEGRGLLGRLIRDTLPDIETRRAFQEFFGDTLTPFMRKAFPVLIGEKNSGKSQLLELAMGLHSNSTGGDLENLDGFEKANFIGKSLVVIDELGKRINEKVFKQMVGGAVMNIARKWMSNVSIRPDFKMLGGCNKIPRFAEKEGAVETRIYPFVIPKRTSETVDEIAQKILHGYRSVDTKTGGVMMVSDQMQDLLDWALNGAAEVAKRGRTLTHEEMPKASRKLKREMEEDTNPTKVWIDDTGCEPTGDHGALIPRQQVYDLFREWAEETGRPWVGKTSQNIWARDLFFPAMAAKFGDMWMGRERRATVDGRQVFCYPVRFTNLKGVKQVAMQEAVASFDRAEAWDPDDLPEHIIQKIKRAAEIKAVEENMSREQAKAYEIERMEAAGFVRVVDPVWGETYQKAGE